METSFSNVTKLKSESKCSEEYLFIYFKIWIIFSKKVVMWQYFSFLAFWWNFAPNENADVESSFGPKFVGLLARYIVMHPEIGQSLIMLHFGGCGVTWIYASRNFWWLSPNKWSIGFMDVLAKDIKREDSWRSFMLEESHFASWCFCYFLCFYCL